MITESGAHRGTRQEGAGQTQREREMARANQERTHHPPDTPVLTSLYRSCWLRVRRCHITIATTITTTAMATRHRIIVGLILLAPRKKDAHQRLGHDTLG